MYFDFSFISFSYKVSFSRTFSSNLFSKKAAAFLKVETLWFACLAVRMHYEQMSDASQSKQKYKTGSS